MKSVDPDNRDHQRLISAPKVAASNHGKQVPLMLREEELRQLQLFARAVEVLTTPISRKVYMDEFVKPLQEEMAKKKAMMATQDKIKQRKNGKRKEVDSGGEAGVRDTFFSKKCPNQFNGLRT